MNEFYGCWQGIGNIFRACILVAVKAVVRIDMFPNPDGTIIARRYHPLGTVRIEFDVIYCIIFLDGIAGITIVS